MLELQIRIGKKKQKKKRREASISPYPTLKWAIPALGR